ncbi:MAG TPA: hypothetical protein VK010_00840, partial [Flavobacteriaceae bacterium]|nr:hypothetical protein [Flavobacteriaceae bacterium]
MKISFKKITATLEKGKAIAALAKLTYSTEKHLCIQRHRRGRGFYYTKNGKKISNKKELERIKKLVIPPAWNEVQI